MCFIGSVSRRIQFHCHQHRREQEDDIQWHNRDAYAVTLFIDVFCVTKPIPFSLILFYFISHSEQWMKTKANARETELLSFLMYQMIATFCFDDFFLDSKIYQHFFLNLFWFHSMEHFYIIFIHCTDYHSAVFKYALQIAVASTTCVLLYTNTHSRAHAEQYEGP